MNRTNYYHTNAARTYWEIDKRGFSFKNCVFIYHNCDSSIAKPNPGNRSESHGFSETIRKGRPVSQLEWHAIEPSMLYGHGCRAYVNICSHSPAMLTSPYEWTILKWDDKLHTNKQKYIHILDCVISIKSVHKSKWGLHKTANSGQNFLIDGFITFK